MKIFIRTALLTITIFLNICENASGMHRDPKRKPDKLIPYKNHRLIGVWKDRNGDVENLHMLPRNNNLRTQIKNLQSYVDEIDNIRFRVFHKDEVIFGVESEPLPPAHSTIIQQTGESEPSRPSSPFQQTGPPQHQTGPSQHQPGSSQSQPSPPHHQPGSPQHQPSSPVFPPGPSQSQPGSSQSQPGSSQSQPGPPQHQPSSTQHQPSPPQHQPSPPGQPVPYHSGYITYDQTIFELWEDPATGKAVDIRPRGVNNWIPTQDEINRYKIRIEHVNDYYPNSFVVYKSYRGKIVGSRLA